MMDLAANSRMITAKRGDIVTVSSTEAGHAYLVKEGHLRVIRVGTGGKAVSLDILEPGDVIGITPIVTEDGDADRAECLNEVLFCRMPTTKLREVLEKHPSLALHFSKLMGLRRKSVETRLIDIAFCTVKVRLARLLIELTSRFGVCSESGTLINLKLTHQEAADMIGSNREAANRAMSQLIDAGAVTYSGKRVLVIDMAKLQEEAELHFDWRNVSADTADE